MDKPMWRIRFWYTVDGEKKDYGHTFSQAEPDTARAKVMWDMVSKLYTGKEVKFLYYELSSIYECGYTLD